MLRDWMRKRWAWIALIAGGVMAVGLMAGVWLWRGPGRTALTVVIPVRSSTAQISRQLHAAGVVRRAWAFRVVARLSGQARVLKAGEYIFAPRSPLSAVVRKLASGEVARHAVTLPEGLTVEQIAGKLAEAGLVEAQAFKQAAADPAVAQALRLPASGLEGFLFPDTYHLAKGMPPRQIASRLVARYREKATPEMIAAAASQGLNERQWVTLASIIEREVRVPEERARVASVFYNRLRNQMRLESCATVLYSQGRSSGALSLEDLQTVSPYNTYRHRGLPPGPICNPGLSALIAAAYPAKTDYLFFVVGPDGRHLFSRDFEEHKRAKRIQKRARRDAADQMPTIAPTPQP